MRSLVFKNLTSENKRTKKIVTSEVMDNNGVRSVIRRHFIWILKEIEDEKMQSPSPCLYVVKEHNTREERENFFCKLKGSICAIYKGKLCLILFMHSLKICLTAIPQGSKEYSIE